MKNAAEYFLLVWNYKISIAPVLITYLAFELPAIVRKLTRVAYVPIYFIFFPTGQSDRLYAQYFNEDYIYGEGSSMDVHQKRALRHRIQATAIFSMIFAAIIAPWLGGFFSSFYLTSEQFFEFLVVLVVVKAISLVWVLADLREESQAARRSFPLIVAIYVGYLFLVIRGLTKSYAWTSTTFETQGNAGILWGILDYVYADFFLNVVVVGGATWAFTQFFTSPANISDVDHEE